MMVRIFHRSFAFRYAFLVLSVIQVAGCDSPDKRAEAYYERGIQFTSEHETAKAAIELRNAVRLKRDLIRAWKALAEIDESNRNWPRLFSDLRTIVELAPNDATARLSFGKLLLLAGSASEALTFANAGIDRDNRNADLHALKAAAAFRLDDRASAAREAEIALRLDPTNADALMVLAIDRLASGDAKGALSLLEDASVAGSGELENNVGFQFLRMKLFGKTGNLDGAEATLKKLVEQNPREPGYRKLLTNFYIEQRRIADAENEMRTLAAAHPADSAAGLDLVRFLSAIKRDPAAARQELNARIGDGGEVFPYQIALAEMDYAEGKLTDARQLLEKLIGSASSPERVRQASIALAKLYLDQRNFDQAERLATDILGKDPHDVSALKLRASIRLERAQFDAAISDLLDALNYQPRSPDLMLLLATAYERSGLIELADKQFADATRVSNFNANIGLAIRCLPAAPRRHFPRGGYSKRVAQAATNQHPGLVITGRGQAGATKLDRRAGNRRLDQANWR